jgi:hypothetical protein
VLWTVTNTVNPVNGVKVTASLPPYVKFTGTMSPTDADLTVDPMSGAIVWNVGEVAKGADIGSGARQVAFQIELRPSANQVGQTPDLVSGATITGKDSFTGAVLQNSAPSLSTRIATDLLYKSGDEVVKP